MEFSQYTTKLLQVLKGRSCVTCKLLIVQDINHFLTTVSDQPYDVSELQYLPFFSQISPLPNLR